MSSESGAKPYLIHYSGGFLGCVGTPVWLAWLIWGTILRFDEEGTILAKFNDSVGLFMMIYIVVTWASFILGCVVMCWMGYTKYKET